MIVGEFSPVPVMVACIIENEDGLDMGSNLKYKSPYWKKGRKITAREKQCCEQRKEHYYQWKKVFS